VPTFLQANNKHMKKWPTTYNSKKKMPKSEILLVSSVNKRANSKENMANNPNARQTSKLKKNC